MSRWPTRTSHVEPLNHLLKIISLIRYEHSQADCGHVKSALCLLSGICNHLEMPRSSWEQKGLCIIHWSFCLGLPQVTVVRKQPHGGIWSMPWIRKVPWRRDRLLTSIFLGFPGVSDSKESTCKAGDLGLIPGLGRSPGEGNGYPLQCSGLENPMDTGAQRDTVHVVAKTRTRLSD